LKVALFGGTFDPVHNGHVNAALELLRQGIVEEVWFVPVHWHAFKDNSAVTAAGHRIAMAELAFAGKKGLKVIDFGQNPTYTIDTILEAKKRFPKHEYFWLIGTDLIQEFSSWKQPEKILREVKLVLYPVPGSEKESSKTVDSGQPLRVQGKAIDLSSTKIREMLFAGKNVSKLMPAAVLEYIKENNLYK